MIKLAIFMFAAVAGIFVSKGWDMVQQHSWGFATVYLLLTAGNVAVAWYHLNKMEVKP